MQRSMKMLHTGQHTHTRALQLFSQACYPSAKIGDYFNSLVIFLINVKAKGVDSKPKVCSFLIFDLKIVDPIHFQILGYLQVLQHSTVPDGKENVGIPVSSTHTHTHKPLHTLEMKARHAEQSRRHGAQAGKVQTSN